MGPKRVENNSCESCEKGKWLADVYDAGTGNGERLDKSETLRFLSFTQHPVSINQSDEAGGRSLDLRKQLNRVAAHRHVKVMPRWQITSRVDYWPSRAGPRSFNSCLPMNCLSPEE